MKEAITKCSSCDRSVVVEGEMLDSTLVTCTSCQKRLQENDVFELSALHTRWSDEDYGKEDDCC